MIQSFKKILNSVFQAKDGNVGHLDDLLFDDQKWIVRYIVVKTGGFLSRDRVLVHPLGVAELDWAKDSVKLNLTREQIEASPSAETDPPLFRQMEKMYFDYLAWPYYWDDISIWGIDPRSEWIVGDMTEEQLKKSASGDVHLQSSRIISTYAVESEDIVVGKLEDFLIDDKNWGIHGLVVDMNLPWPNRPVVLNPRSVDAVRWIDRSVVVSLTRDQMRTKQKLEYTDHGPRP